eukprot:CAMPEP_0203867472 /NCGR_PEP_ID=MMETSP0359-20131031/16540_1 /ASSEMBLY_ACC=CAM_ASM_000338 /TAXON_ID=268821 /ORGANISM="Scrippsiella Hangoei, Strain SHTV-5" /LENGTH=106 /DNA_ID=CAMNT_0050785713 /DNA_START=32 /DNA_END=352 /DNA_ORIENTATION=-
MGICAMHGSRGPLAREESIQQCYQDQQPRILGKASEILAEKTLLKNPISKHTASQKEMRQVDIDKTTSIPFDLYSEMMKEGDRAKNAGQHQLRGHRSGRPHLVITR